ncbi:MAG: UDP-N-acetylglucosamine 2-epimerase (non-hydrolyzing) [Desulfurococcales archaeon ex4484_217_2]|nr:MAG: UDP-N-acetylglucosamine 2-epimerase (non-hydrolyzing) [Desulfurococcales archaeon ex4484_217_2]
MVVAVIVGTRPQNIKLYSLVKMLERGNVDFYIVHTGQHYDYGLDRMFFEELGLPEPRVYLGVGSGTHGYQVATIVLRLEKYFIGEKPSLVIVPGDTNSALGGALASVKLGIPVAHVEAGLRSRLPFMAEEVNRVLIDHMSDILFAPTIYAYENLLREGVDVSKVFLTGDVMVDNIVMLRNEIERVQNEFSDLEYAYVTIHRAENTDNPARLKGIFEGLRVIAESFDLKIVFPMHPRTRIRARKYGLEKILSHKNIHVLEPVSYLKSLRLQKDSKIVITDSGGVQKEAFVFKKPTITLRETTEWVETVEYGWNILTNPVKKDIVKAVQEAMEAKPINVDPYELYGGGKASLRILRIIKEYIS